MTSLVAAPDAGAQFTFTPAGGLRVTPPKGFVGVLKVSYTIRGCVGAGTSTTTVTVTVTGGGCGAGDERTDVRFSLPFDLDG